MNGGKTPPVTGRHSLNQFQSLTGPKLTNHDTIRTHPQSREKKVTNRDSSQTLRIRRTRFKRNDVRQREREFTGIFDGNNALLHWSEASNTTKKRGLAATCSPRNQ
jgi:hypothetical protein